MGQPQYNHLVVEKKWQDYWDEYKTFSASDVSKLKRSYVLDMFPYPSAQGLHVGHPEGYTATDIYCRYLRMTGVNVLHPMGWDAFGLPAENYAIKTGRHPREVTWENIENFRRQIQSLGFSYDWSREVNTADPSYYKWTQWLFLKLYKEGLAYQKEAPVNWCPSCQTVLANEQVVDWTCERCQTVVEQRQMNQWFFKITDYADQLLKDLGKLDWPEPILQMQKNWIGESQGALVKFPLINVAGQADKKHVVEVFTTRLDTIFGATFIVISPELAQKWVEVGWQVSSDVKKYMELSLKGKELDRVAKSAKEKTGVETGVKAINPATNEAMPVWIADYVLGSYGTGAIMAVPAHDERDNEFAKKFNLPIIPVIEPLFIDESSIGKVKDDKPIVERVAIMAIVKHAHEDKYIGLRWKKINWETLITGGVESGVTPTAAAIAEIIEETGYLHPNLKKELSRVHSKFFHGPKNENRLAHFFTFYFELDDMEKKEVTDSEKAIHDMVWLTKEEMMKFNLPPAHREVWNWFKNTDLVYSGEGILKDSGKFTGLSSAEAIPKIAKKLGAELKTQYRLRDWLISRQRYWGAPIPIIHCAKCGAQPVSEKDLPVELPNDVDFRPTGESPLVRSESFHKVNCPKCGKPAKRESDTMDTFVDSSWYWLRYCDPNNNNKAFDIKKINHWCPVNLYVGGAEHAVLHLLYARFITKTLNDLKYIKFDEPFLKLKNQGLILAEDGQKMSKSRGNVVNPDEIVLKYGADTLRIYEMFMGPLEDAKPWNTSSIMGVRRFLERVWKLGDVTVTADESSTASKLLDRYTKKITEDINNFKFNTAVSALMELCNELSSLKPLAKSSLQRMLILLYPFAPHLSCEMWSLVNLKNNIWDEVWPTWDEKNIIEDIVSIVVQINGVKRAVIDCAVGSPEKIVHNLALADSKIAERVAGQQVKRVIFVKDKLINLVVS